MRSYLYQEAAVGQALEYLATRPGVLFELCVGSGKSLIDLMLTAALFSAERITRAILLVPLLDIRDQFSKYDSLTVTPWGDSFPWGGDSLLTLPKIRPIQGSADFGRALDLSRVSTTPEVLVLSYSTMRCYKDRFLALFDDLSTTIVTIDEGHHVYDLPDDCAENAKRNEISEVVYALRRRGAKTIQMSATPSRYDGHTVHLLDADGVEDPVITRSLLTHIAEGFAPPLLSEFIRVEGQGTSDTETVAMPAEEHGYIQVIASYLREGFPFLYCRLKCVTEIANRRVRERLRDSFLEVGANPLILVAGNEYPEDKARWKRLCALFSRDVPPTYEEIRAIADVIICHHMLDEGVDIPAFSHTYFWGIPRSMGTIMQVSGRAMRRRYDLGTTDPVYPGYPAAWRCTSKAVFCISALEKTEKESELMHQLGGQLFSTALAGLLRVVLECLSFVQRAKGEKPSPKGSPEPFIEHLDLLKVYLARACAWYEQAYRSPLSDISPTAEAHILSALALDMALQDECDLPKDTLKKTLDLACAMYVSQKYGKTAPLRDVLTEDVLDPGTRAAIDRALPDFVAQAQALPQWILSGELKEHFSTLGRVTGATATREEAVAKAVDFKERHGRYPGSFGRALSVEPVPGEVFCFDRLNRHQWRSHLVDMLTPVDQRARLISEARIEWGRFAKVDGPQRDRGRFTELRRHPDIQALPLFVYFLEVLWIPSVYTWTDRLSVRDLALLGIWSAKTDGAVFFDENEASLELICRCVDNPALGVGHLITLIRTKNLDSLKEV